LEVKDNVIGKELAAGKSWTDWVTEAYLSSLARPPTELEKTKMVAALSSAPETGRRAAAEDVYWAILSSKEFLFNH
jgi:hypothetical protein